MSEWQHLKKTKFNVRKKKTSVIDYLTDFKEVGEDCRGR